jgi:hypothetical protein
MLFAELEALVQGAKRWQGKLAQLPLKEGKSHALKLLLDQYWWYFPFIIQHF